MSKDAARAIFVVGTVVCILAFVALTVDTLIQLPARTNEQAMTAQVVAGKVAWQTHDCTDCHTLLGNGAYYAPELTKVTLRRGEPFVHAWLTAPARQMPDQHLTAEEVTSLVAFLHWVAAIDTNGWPPEPVYRVAAASTGNDLVSQGATLFEQRGCVACHGGQGQGTPTAPTLRGVTARRGQDYLVRWLADPLAVNPAARMPNLGLQGSETQALIAYLGTLN